MRVVSLYAMWFNTQIYFPTSTAHTNKIRLLIAYINDKCATQNEGKHTRSGVPKQIAKYLSLKGLECTLDMPLDQPLPRW